MTNLIVRLIVSHRMLSREIRREMRHRVPDHFRLMRLKKQRLAVKDQLQRHFPEAAHLRTAARHVLRRLRVAAPGPLPKGI